MRKILFFLVALLCTSLSYAQLSGIKTIPGDYANIAAAITDLNTVGVGPGGVTFNIAAAYTETFTSPTAGTITATGTAANPIVFQKSGAGANPLITAGTGTTTTTDGIIKIAGGDYISFVSVDLQENAANTTATQQMEWGYAIVKASATDGAKFINITGCSVTLNKANTASVGIYGGNHIATSTTSLTVTAASGTNSDIKINGCTVSNVYIGISISGYTTSTYYDSNLEIGTTTGNTISNYGGGSSTTYGIYITGQTAPKIENNTVTLAAGTTTTAYGINVASACIGNLKINANTVSVASSATTSQLCAINNLAPIATTVDITNNIIQNCSYTTATSGNFIGIYDQASTTGCTINITGNTISGLTYSGAALAGSGTAYAIYCTTGSPTAVNANNNNIFNNTMNGSTGGIFYGIYLNKGTAQTASNNSIYNNTISGTGTSGTIYCIRSTTGTIIHNNNSIYNNQNTKATGTGGIYGIYNVASPTVETYSGNTIYGLTHAGAGTVSCMNMNTTAGTRTVSSNLIYQCSSAGGTVYGIYQAASSPNIFKNRIYNLSSVGAAGAVYGIYISSGTVVNIYNNFISDLKTPSANAANPLAGIYVSGGTTVDLYYNTVFLNTSSTGALFGSCAVYASTTPAVDMRNNIFVNTSTPAGATGFTCAYRRSGTTLTTYAATSNNNDFFAGTPGATNLIYYDGTNSDQTLTAYKARVTPRDASSVTENPPFINAAATPYDLHISTTIATQCESNGNRVTTPVAITDDYDAGIRWGETGYAGTGTAPDIGADEFNGISLDVTPPIIIYTPLTNTLSTSARTLTATITDISGVGSGANQPVLYWTRNGILPYTGPVSPTGIVGNQYTFSFGAGVSSGDVVSYFIVAQDALGNVGSVPTGATTTANPPLATAPPATPSTYNVVACISGVKTVGTGGDYATLTAAFTDLNNNKGLCGPLTLSLTDASYTAAETFPLVLNQVVGASIVNTVTIKPAAGVTASISGSVASGAMIKLASSFIIIDGSNAAGGTSRDLTMTNTSATTPSVLLIASTGTNPVTDVVIKNSIVINGSTSATAIVISDISLGTAGYFNNITIQNNSIQKAYNGCYIIAVPGTGNGSGLVITGNDLNTSGANNIRLIGLYVQGVDGFQITGNNIGNFASSTSETARGIWTASGSVNGTISGNTISTLTNTSAGSAGGPIGICVTPAAANANVTVTNNTINGLTSNMTGSATQSGILLAGASSGVTITRNKIYTLNNTNSGGYTTTGILLASTLPAANTTVANNLIYDITAYGYNSLVTDNAYGIWLYSGGGYNLYFNTVKLSTNQTVATGYPACLAISSSVVSPVDIRNNIFQMNESAGTNRFAILCNAANTIFSEIDYNLYYSSDPAFGYLGSNITTLAGWKAATGKDVHSLNVDPQLVSNTDLRPNTVSPALGAGTPLAGFPNDYLNVVRNATTPTIGAYEVGVDVTGPVITYVPFGSTSITTARTLVCTITDPTGVPVAGIGLPVLYWKVNGGSYSAVTATSLGGNQYQFIFGAGVVIGDVVSYYIVAQDTYSPINLTCSPSAGAAGFTSNPPAVATPPTTPNSYTILASLAGGNYLIGGTATSPSPGCTFVDLTAAFADLNTKEINGPVTLILTSTYASTEEDAFPLTLNQIAGASAINTVTIRPNAGTTVNITGSSASSIIKLNGADYVTINGSNAGTTSQDLTIANSSVASQTAVIWIASTGTGTGSTNNTIKNTVIKGGTPGTTSAYTYGIFVGGTSISNSGTGADNDALLIENNNISKAFFGIYLSGTSTGSDDNLQIINNSIGSSVSTDYIGRDGIYLNYCNNAAVTGNTVYNINGTNTTPVGITLGTGVMNTTASANSIFNITYTGTGGYGGRGFYINTGSATSGLIISNNLVSQILGDGYTGFSNSSPVGMYIDGTTGGLNIWNNSVSMNGNVTRNAATITTSILFYTSTITAVDLRNNIFSNTIVNTANTGAKSYAIYSAAPSTSFTMIDRNDYYGGGTQGVLGYFGGADKTTLTAWQTATGSDANSISADPVFVSATDLHVSAQPVNNGGVSIAGVTTDYAGTTRTNPPDIGAYEFTLPITSINTLAATTVLQTTATVNGNINTNNESVAMSFEYGQTIAYGSNAAATPSPARSVSSTAISAGLTGLTPNTLYHYRIKGASATSAEVVYGTDMTFVTLPLPTLSGPATICQASMATYTTEAGNSNYTWTVSPGNTIMGGGTSTSNTITIVWNASGPQTVSVNYENSLGNPAPSATVYNVTVNPIPFATITGPNDVCQGVTGVVYSTQPGMTGYTWGVSAGGTITAGGTATDNTVTVTWNTVGLQGVTVNYTDGNGCNSFVTVYAVNVNARPAPVITGPTTSCAGTTGVVYTTESGQSAYTWTVSAGGTITAGGTATDNTVTVTWNTVGPQSVSVNYSNASSCTAVSPTVYNVTVNARPTPTLAGPVLVCEGTTGHVYTTEAGQSSYNWSISGGTITSGGTSTDNTATVTWTTPGARSISVNYNNSDGCPAAIPTLYNVTVNPVTVPTISGPAAVFTGTSGNVYTTEAGMTNYVWNISAGGTVTAGGTATDNTVTITWNIAGAQTVSVNYTNSSNCSAATATVYNVLVSAMPGPAGTITGVTPVCQNQNGVAFSVPAVVNATGYNWTLPAGATIATGSNTNNITVDFSSTAVSGVISVYGFNGLGNGIPSPDFNITVNTAPVPTLAGLNTVCAGTTGVVYTTEAAMNNYIWNISAGGTITSGGTSTDNTATVTWNTAGAQTISVNYSNANSCTAATPATTNVTVNPLPVPTLSGPASVCLNSTGNIYTTEAGMTGYSWTINGGTITSGGTVTSNTATVTWTATGARSISVNYTNAGLCTAASATVYNVTVNPLPVPTITGSASVCLNSMGNIYSTQPGMTGYTWTVSAGGMIIMGSGTNAITVGWNTLGPQTVSVSYTNTNNCTPAAPTVYNVTVNPLPAPSITGNASVCVNSTGVVYTTEAGMSSYTWTISAGGTITAGAGTNAITVTWNAAGPQTVSVNYANGFGCTAASPATFNVTVNPLPVPVITGPASACAGSAGNVYSTTAGMSGYIWTVSAGGIISFGTGTNSITVTWVVAGPQTVTLNYTNGSGCTAATPTVYNVTVNGLPVPTLAGPATVCAATTGNVYTTEAGMTGYVWNISAGGTVTAGGNATSNTATITWNTAGPQTVSVNYTNGNGCTAVAPVNYNVTVNPRPTPTITGPATVCANSTGNVYTTQAGMTGYNWTITGGTITAGSGTSAVTVTWNTAGAQTLTVNYSNASGCQATTPASYPVTVNAVPVPTITGPATACTGATGIVYTTQAGMTGYAWTVSGGGTLVSGSGTNSITVTWNTTGAQSVSVNYTNGGGCTAAAPVVYPVTVSPMVAPTITGTTSLCVNSGYYTYTTEAGNNNYTWNISSGGIINYGSGTNQVQVSWITAGAQWISVTYTSPGGCSPATPTTLNVTVNPLPSAAGAVIGTATVCGGTMGVAYSTPAISGAVSYVWTLPVGATIASGSGTNSITVNFAPDATSGNITVYGNNLCGNGAVSPNFPVTVTPLVPAAGTITGETVVCSPAFNISYSIAPLANATGYNWSLPAGTVLVSGSNTPSIVVNFPGGAQSGDVSVYGLNSCGNGTAATLGVTINAIPDAPVISAVDADLTSSAPLGNQWYYSSTAGGTGTALTGATAQTYTATQTGFYWSVVTLNECSSDTSNHLYIIIDGINEILAGDYNIFPVPNDGRFSITITGAHSPISITVVSSLGIKVYENKTGMTNGRYEVDMRPAVPGVYTVVFSDGKQRMMKKIVVE